MSPKRINTHKLSYNSRHRSHDHTCTSGKAAILQIPINPANPASDNDPKRINTHKLSYNSRKRLHDHTCTSGKAAILQIPINPANPASDNEPETHKHSQTLVQLS